MDLGEEERNWKNAVEIALKKLDKDSWPEENNSRFYDLRFEDKLYPPKVVFRTAADIIKNDFPEIEIPKLGGGIPTNSFLVKLDFEIIDNQKGSYRRFDLSDKKLYKLSMGTLRKNKPYKGTSVLQDIKDYGLVLVHENTGRGQAELFSSTLKVGDVVYITYGNILDQVAEVQSDLIPLPSEVNNKELLKEWKVRKVKYLFKPRVINTNKLSGHREFWLPSGNSTIFEVPNIDIANDILFKPYYNLEFFDNNIQTPMKGNSEEQFYADYQNYLSDYIGEISQSTANSYLETLKSHLSEWCKITDIDYLGLVNYNKKELSKANSALRKGDHTFKGMMRFQWYIGSLLPEFHKNQILYGPPGTGKTYSTKELAVKIANPYFSIDDDLDLEDDLKRELYIDEYNRLCDSGQIVFTTFHQSFSYEDFVEGIKPETIDNQVTYSVVPGIFKEICEKADTKEASNFEDALNRFKSDVVDKEKITINTGTIEFDVFYKGGKTFRINPKDSKVENPLYPTSIENILKLYKNSPNENMYNPSYVKGILNHLYSEYDLKKYDSIDSNNKKNYVLIIDEINRGNVSAIFGELITLLEPDKRLGANEEILVKLPYSKDETFGVPANLYIIGTMNTADRSVEALDTALRRRFVFHEVMPKPELLEHLTFDGFNLKQVLETINDRIEALLDRDHTIGHSYFIKLDGGDKEELSNVFKNNIIPLLQEYFYNDYEKIALVLGEGFVIEKPVKRNIFPKFTNIEEPEPSQVYQLIPDVKDIEKAIRLLLNTPNES